MAWFLPSLSALRTFEAAARHLSFTSAASELHITQSAVSRQIRGLEEVLQLKLFERTPKQLVITEAGRIYLQEIRAALERIQAATLSMRADRGRGGTLVIATLPAFGMKWLIPRLNSFVTENPDILINLVTKNGPFDLEAERVDAAIHFGHNDWPGAAADHLVGEEVVPVCSPSYAEKNPPPKSPSDLGQHTLLQHGRRPNTWRLWFEAAGANVANHWSGPSFEHFYMVLQAAVAGLGVALLPRLLVADEIASGRLITVLDRPYRTDDAYYIVYPEAKRDEPKLGRFRTWLHSMTNETIA